MFGTAQRLYAERGIATFPVTAAKVPAIRGYLRTGLNGSRELATKFPDAPALGFACSARNGIAVLDIDTKDERVLRDALDRHGSTPIVVRTASRKFHAYYRHNGERRRIRPWPGRKIDLLGTGGMAVAPPSSVARGNYQFIEGSIDDIGQLPVLQNLELPTTAVRGARNNQLWRHCMKNAHHVDTFGELLDVAHTYNDDCLPPMEDSEVTAIAQSAWGYTERGENRFGQFGAWLGYDDIAAMMEDQDSFFLLAYLRAENGPSARFWCTNSLAEKFGWYRQRMASARNRLIELGYIKPVRQASQGNPAEFRWAK